MSSSALSSRPRIGILGAGQLALMLAQAAPALGIDVICAGQPGDCAEQAAQVVAVDLADAAAVARFTGEVDLLTIESENIDARVLRDLPVAPNTFAVRIAQDRLLEKTFFNRHGVQTAPFAIVDSLEDLEFGLAVIGTPAILKTRRMGYDGRGQVRLMDTAQPSAAWDAVGRVPSIVEGMVPFEAEVSLFAARSAAGEMALYPLTCNVHREGILRRSTAPFDNPALQKMAEQHLRSTMAALQYVGVLAVEFFVRDGDLIANEMAPRVHNSGHWTIEGAETSQFANHLRALVGLPLGRTVSWPTVMLNCIGSMPPEDQTARFPEAFRHDYGKEPRPGRKVGHLSFPAEATDAIRYWEEQLAGAE